MQNKNSQTSGDVDDTSKPFTPPPPPPPSNRNPALELLKLLNNPDLKKAMMNAQKIGKPLVKEQEAMFKENQITENKSTCKAIELFDLLACRTCRKKQIDLMRKNKQHLLSCQRCMEHNIIESPRYCNAK
jgi:hypothetical protein